MSKLSKKLIEIREQNNLTQEAFAESLFVTRQAVSKWERDICYPDIETLKKIALKYKISLNVLLDIIDENKSKEIKDLAHKSYGFLTLLLIGTIVCLVLGITSLFLDGDSDRSAKALAFTAAGFFGLIPAIQIIIYPKKPIKYNDYGLYLTTITEKDVFIKYEDIVEVKAKTSHARIIRYTFGKIIIDTKKDVYVVRNISDVDSIKGTIIELKTKNTLSEIN